MSQPHTLPVAAISSSSRSRIRRVILAGFMGAGKSTVGRALASALGWRLLDLDTLIEDHAGQTIAQLFESQGEIAFRRLESFMLARALGQHEAVIALGGGAPETLTNRLLLEQTPGTRVVFLRAPFPTLFDRCMLDAVAAGALNRPNLQDPAAAEVRFRIRQAHYRRVAHLIIDTLEQTPEQTTEAVRLALLSA